MRQLLLKRLLIVFAILNFSYLSHGQTTLFSETFDEAVASTSGMSSEGLAWNASCPTCTTGSFEVQAGSFFGENTDGRAEWFTDPIDVSDCKSFRFTVTTSGNYATVLDDNTECGSCNGSIGAPDAGCNNCWDYSQFELRLDNVTADNVVYGIGNNPAGTSAVSLDHCDNTASEARLRISIQNDEIGEIQSFDNVTLVCYEEDAHQIEGQQTVCDDMVGTTEYSVTPADAGQTYLWSVTGGTPTTSADLTMSNFFVDWSSVANGTYTVAVDITDPFGCTDNLTQEVNVVSSTPYTLTCNSLVNLTLDDNCSLDYLLPEMFLEAMQYTNDAYTVKPFDLNDPSIDPTTDPTAYLGMEIGIEITALCGGNSCWGKALIEDKSITPLECSALEMVNCQDVDVNLGFPTNVTGYVLNADGTYTVPNYDNCGNATLYYTDFVVNTDCSNPTFSSVIDRTWVIFDAAGNSSTCVTTINVNPSTLDDIIFPPHYDTAFTPNNGSLLPQPCGNWPALENGNPDPSHTGMPTGDYCLNVEIGYHDTKFNGCSDLDFKILREWTVTDVCANPPVDRVYVQNIVVMRDAIPIVTCPVDAGASAGAGYEVASEIPTNDQYTCTADWSVVPPTIINPCGDYTWTIEYLLANEAGEAPITGNYISTNVTGSSPNYVINDLPIGPTWVKYVITDVCGNTDACYTEVLVYDDSTPQAVCDLHSNIALNADKCAYATTATFDDGSFACADVTLGIRRAGTSSAFTDEIKFTCADANQTVLIELQATAQNGTTSTCVVEAFVQDPSTSSATFPASTSVSLDCVNGLNLSNLDGTFGSASVVETLCGEGSVTEIKPAVANFNDCGAGTIVRTWRYTNQDGTLTTRTQTITVTLNNPFTGAISWPNDVTLSGCKNTAVLPDDITGSSNQRPTWSANACSSVFSTYEDVPFYFVENVCVKILRKWTVIDWCQASTIPGSGIWEYSQVIKINDDVKPSIDSGCNLPSIVTGETSNCNQIVSFTATATDNCPDELSWSASVDGIDRNITVSGGTATMANVQLSPGTHTICWDIADACGNTDQCCDSFTIEHNVGPTAACISVLTTVISTPGPTMIWASDFDASSTKGCSASSDLRFAFSTNPFDTNLSLTCADLADGIIDSMTVDIYVFDADNNYDFCTATLIIQDNGNHCTDVVTGNTRIDFSGNIQTEFEAVVDEVMVTISSDNLQSPASEYMAYDGVYAFPNLDMYNDYSVSAEKTDDVMNGVSTLDLVLIQKHLLGISSLDSPYKIIAADANNSGNLSAIDLVELRKLILGVYTEFPNNTSWRFVDADHTFADTSNPFPFNEVVGYNDVDHNIADADFIAVKIGDVNETVVLSNAQNTADNRSVKKVSLDLATAKIENDLQKFDLSMTNDELVLGMQFTLEYNADDIQIADITSEYLEVSEANFAQIEAGVMTFSWNDIDGVALATGQNLLTIEYTSLNSNSSIAISSSITQAEMYTVENNTTVVKGIELKQVGDSQFALHQNVPNPFKTETVIQFQLPEASKATINIFDANGKILFALTDEYSKGLNEVIIDGNQLQHSGILYYQLNSYTNSATKKLIVLK